MSYHDYYGILIDDAERDSIIKDLGPENMVSAMSLGDICGL